MIIKWARKIPVTVSVSPGVDLGNVTIPQAKDEFGFLREPVPASGSDDEKEGVQLKIKREGWKAWEKAHTEAHIDELIYLHPGLRFRRARETVPKDEGGEEASRDV